MLRDLLSEAWGAVVARRIRSIMTAAGIAIGLLTLTATVGLTATLAGQVSSRFDALVATTVTVENFEPAGAADYAAGGLARVRNLNGVLAAGAVAYAGGDPAAVVVNAGDRDEPTGSAAILASDAAALQAWQVKALNGRLFDEGHDRRRERVVLVGDLIARTLGLDGFRAPTVIRVGQEDLLVLGIVRSNQPTSPVGLSLIVPSWMASDTSTDLGMKFGSHSVIIRTALGAAAQVGREAPSALSPTRPDSLTAQVPPDPRSLRRQVESDTAAVVLVLGAVSLVVGALGVSNTMLISVLERRHELGVRRAVGAGAGQVLSQIMLESLLLGLAGGTFGGVLGVNLTALISLIQGWTLVVPYWLLLAGPALGAIVGLIAGLYPARRAAQIEPIAALTT